jgi:UDP-N-acetylglucosamine 2-epimerase
LHTGQHYDRALSKWLLRELGVKPHVNLATTDLIRMAVGIAATIGRKTPDWVLVYGDTRSTEVGAATAALRGVPIAHVEAGLRCGDLDMPEEKCRVFVDKVSSLLLCPDEAAVAQLESEGSRVRGQRAVVTGDVMADACRLYAPPPPEGRVRGSVFATFHREANIPRLPSIVGALGESGADVILAAHPRTRRALEGVSLPANVEILPSQGYADTLWLVASSACVVTDSGGLQKEAYWLGTPCVTVRPSTEWTATVDAGANVLVEPEGIPGAVAAAKFPVDAPQQLYGDGYAAERIVEALLA